jgi:hypothetical protein
LRISYSDTSCGGLSAQLDRLFMLACAQAVEVAFFDVGLTDPVAPA